MQPAFRPDDEWQPEPQPFGRLGPPGRKPPTAVACATPSPPGEPFRRTRRRRLNALQGIARGALSVCFIIVAALAVETLTPLAGAAVGAGFGSLGAVTSIRLVRAARDS